MTGSTADRAAASEAGRSSPLEPVGVAQSEPTDGRVVEGGYHRSCDALHGRSVGHVSAGPPGLDRPERSVEYEFQAVPLALDPHEGGVLAFGGPGPPLSLVDVDVGDGYRTVHVGDPDQDPAGLWLMEPTNEAERARVGDQTGRQPSFVFYTDDLAGTHGTPTERGVDFTSERESDESSSYVHFEDLYGNHGVLVERTTD